MNRSLFTVIGIIIFSSCAYNGNEEVVGHWYLDKVVDLETNGNVIQEGCQYLFLTRENKFESMGFVKENGNWKREGDVLALNYKSGKVEKIDIKAVTNEKLILIHPQSENRVEFIFVKNDSSKCRFNK